MSVEPDSSYVVSSPERDIVTAGVIKGGREKRWTLQEMSSALEKLVESSTTKDNELEVKIEAAPSPAASLAPPSPHTGGSSPRPSSSGGQDLSFAASSHLEIDPQAIDEHLEKRFGEGWAERMILGDADERTAEETIKQEVQLKEKSPLDVDLDTPKVDVEGFDPELAKLLSPNVFTGGTTTPNEEDLDLKDLEAMAPTSTSTPVKETRGRVSMIFTAATPTSESKERFQDLDRISSSTPTAASSFVIRNRSRSNTPTPTESSSTAAPSLTSASTKTSITSSRKEPPPPLKIDLDLTISSPSPVRKLIPLDNATSAPGSPISSKRRSIQSVHSLQRAPFVFSPGDTTPLSAASAPNFAPNSNVHGMAALGVAGGRRPAGRSPLLESRTIHTDGEDIAPLRPQHTGGTARSVSLKLGKERDREMGNRRSLDVGNDGEKYNRPSTSTAQYTPRVGRSPQSFLNHAKREELMPPRSVTSLGRIRKDEIPPRSVTSLGSASPFKTRGSIDMGHTAPLPRVVTNVVGRNRRGYSVDEGNSPNQGNRDRSATVSSTSTANSGGGGMLGGMGPLTRRAFVAAGLLDVDREGSTSPVREREIWREMPTSAGTSGSGGSGGHVGLGGGGGTGSEFSVETGRTSVSGVPPGKPSFDDAQYLHASPLTPSGGQTRTLYGSTTPSKSTPTSTNIKHHHHYHHAHEEIQHSTTLRTLRERHEESIRQLRSQHDDNLRILRQQHEESTCELRTQHEEAIQVLKMENEEKVQLLQERHELEKDALLSALSENKRSLTRVKEENMRLEKYVKELEERLVGALDLNRRSVKAVIEGGGGASSPRMKQPTVPGRRVATMMGHTRTQSSTVTSSMNEDKELDNGSRMAARRLLIGRAPERAGVGKGHPSSLRPTTPTSRLTASVGAGVLRSAGLPVSDTAEDDSAKLAPWTKQPRHRRSVASESSIVLPTPSRMHSMLFDVQAPAATSELLFQDDGGESEFGLHSDTETEHLGAMAIHMTTTPPSPSSNTRPVSEIMAGRGASPNFSFSMRSASPGSLRLRPEDELHLADLGSLMDDRESLREVDDEDEYDEDGYYYDDDDLLHGGYTLRA
ncbi:hypothetical protein FRC03_012001 [Tulasnella sp. 419]|nr:hypothetical protein FRC03_012001 [Tulasnella sp. 419]